MSAVGTETVEQAAVPGSFIAAQDPLGDRTWMELLFLSFTTLTSTGLSDVVPVEPFARSLVMLEQLAGPLHDGGGDEPDGEPHGEDPPEVAPHRTPAPAQCRAAIHPNHDP